MELKNRININTEANLNLACNGAQRDFAFTSPAGGCHFTLSGDGLCFVFLRTHVEQKKLQTTVSSLYCTKEMEGLKSFLTDFAKVLRASVGRSPEAAFVHAPYKPEELQVGSYQFVRPLAVNENTVVAQLHTKTGEQLALKYDRESGRNSIKRERAIMAHLTEKGLNRYVTPYLPYLRTKSSALMPYCGQALDNLCLCDPARNQRICDAVEKQVSKALEAFHKHDLAFVDIHPGNILIQEHGDAFTVTLTDIESIRPTTRGQEGTWQGDKPVAAYLTFVKSEPWHTADNDLVSLKAVLRWIASKSIPVKPT